MTRWLRPAGLLVAVFLLAGCATYAPRQTSFTNPADMPNALNVSGAVVAAYAYASAAEAERAFGFNIIGAGLIPIQVSFENGPHPLRIVPGQTFLEDDRGAFWPVLEDRFAYERAARFGQGQQVFQEGAYNAFWGATAGAILGAAVGVVTGDFGRSVGHGAILGAASGAVMGGSRALADPRYHHRLIHDFQSKSLQNRPIEPNGLAFGYIFFPGEARSARMLRLQLEELDTGRNVAVKLPLF